MTPERYEQIHRLFLEAQGLNQTDRSRFLEKECGDDEKLQKEVEELLELSEDSAETTCTPT